MEYQKTCVLLLRASSKRAIARQEAYCRILAMQKELEIRAVFREKKGGFPKKREVLRYMRAYATYNADVAYVIAYKQNSIARNNSEFFLIKHLLRNCPIEFLFVVRTPQPNF